MSWIFKGFPKFLLAAMLLITLNKPVLFSAESSSIYFYNPDSNIQNYQLLLQYFSEYAKPLVMNFKFQSFISIETLIKISLTRRPGFMILPYWNFKLLEKDKSFAYFGIKTLLTTSVNSNIYYKKILLVKNNSNINDVSGLSGKVAATSLGFQSVDFLEEFVFETKVENKKINFIWTKKDIDSLLALKFNQVSVAIINDKIYNEVKQSQPKLIEDVKIIKESKEIPEVVLITLNVNTNNKTIDEIKKIFVNMQNTNSGKKLLGLLGYEKWVEMKK